MGSLRRIFVLFTVVLYLSSSTSSFEIVASAQTPNPPLTPPTENVTVHFIDVGQGDAIFVDTPALDMLVDGGSRAAGETVVDYLQELDVTRIDIVVATHPHADHIGGLITVLSEYNVSQIPLVVDSGYEATTVTYQDYITSVGQRTFQTVARGDILTLDESVYVTILNPTSPLEFDDANDNSIVLILQVYNVTFLLTGDSEAMSEASIQAAGFDLRCTILKVGHHGSRTSTSPAYLEAIDPDVAVISVGEGNRYDHPHQETLDKLAAESLTVYRTDLHGTVEITTDGVDYSVKTEELGPSRSRELTLFEGWNLIGLPLTPEDPSTEVVLADILDKVTSVWAFDGETKTWSSYSPGAPSDLTEIVEGRGYWITMTEDATLTVRGEYAHTRELALFEGWNLIGLPLIPEDPSIEVVLADILDKIIAVWAFDGETKTWSSYSPGAPSDLTEIVEGRGYWINVNKDVILTIYGDSE